MGTTMILARCKADTDEHPGDNGYSDETREFWIDIEFKGPEEFHKLADETTCPVCGSSNWATSDWAQNR